MQSQSQFESIAAHALKTSRGEQTEVVLMGTDAALTRFSNNEIHQNVAERDVTLMVRLVLGKRVGVANTNDISKKGIEQVMEQAYRITSVLPENPEFPGLPVPKPVPQAGGFSIETAECGPEQRAAAVDRICRRAEDVGLVSAGAFSTNTMSLLVANSLGVHAFHQRTFANLLAVAMSDSSSGYADRTASNVRDIDAEAVVEEAVRRAELGKRPVAVEPGEYEVLLEPYAVSDLLDFLSYLGFSALAVQESRSFMGGKFGQRLVGANVSIWDDGLDPAGIPMPFGFDGMPKRRVDFFKDGIAKEVCHDTITAAKDKVETTGHALPPGMTYGPLPVNLFMGGGAATHEQMIASMKRGLIVTRFWYTRVVHPLTATMTGMTRDGTFLVENGKVVGPVKNLRFTQSYLEALNHVDLVGKQSHINRSWFSFNRVPALKIGKWNFTGATEF